MNMVTLLTYLKQLQEHHREMRLPVVGDPLVTYMKDKPMHKR